MRIWHILFTVFTVAMMMAIWRDPIGRVALVVFFTAIGMFLSATSTIMLLFRAIAALGSADSTGSYIEAIAATAGVLVLGATAVLFVLWCGVGVLTQVVGWT